MSEKQKNKPNFAEYRLDTGFTGLAAILAKLTDVKRRTPSKYFINGYNLDASELEAKRTSNIYLDFDPSFGFTVTQKLCDQEVATTLIVNRLGKVTYYDDNVDLTKVFTEMVIDGSIHFNVIYAATADPQAYAQEQGGRIVSDLAKCGIKVPYNPPWNPKESRGR